MNIYFKSATINQSYEISRTQYEYFCSYKNHKFIIQNYIHTNVSDLIFSIICLLNVIFK